MVNKWITNEVGKSLSFYKSIRSVLFKAYQVDIAVSYVLLSGWELLEPSLRRIPQGNIRMLITDQLLITHPEALRRALALGIKLRNYNNGRFYHPKAYIAYDKNGKPKEGILGSANISESALTKSVEAGVATRDRPILNKMKRWFDELFKDDEQSYDVDHAMLKKLDLLWIKAAEKRAKIVRRSGLSRKGGRKIKEVSPEENEFLEDIFSTIRQPIGILSFDHAANNVRNLERALNVLIRYPKINSKEKSELHLLGFMEGGELTALGKRARRRKTIHGLASTWCVWVAKQSEADLENLNIRLASFKRAANQFWKLKSEVSKFFLKNLHSHKDRALLQTIELLCNGSSVARKLSLSELELLAPKIMKGGEVSKFVVKRVKGYFGNKGSRSWSGDDRKIILTTWKKVIKK